MPHLFSHEGMAHLNATLRRSPLLAFDFDGTLAPIVPRPDDARISPGIAARLQRLARLLPLAVVSGRSVADVRARLGFEPRYVLGNHGAEGLRWPGQEHQDEALASLRECLHARHDELTAAGIMVEDKGASLALHYRLARDREQAIALLQAVLHPPSPQWRVFGGKMVVNVAPAAAPDKADAVMSLLAHCGAESAFFAGDDINDEPVFAAAPPHWLTVRIGRDDQSSRAMYFLDGPSEMGLLLHRMLDLLQPPAGQASTPG